MGVGKEQTIVINIDNQIITSEKAILESMTVNHSIGELTRISLEFVCMNHDFVSQFMDEEYKPKIRNKRVDDCTVKELLFAVRVKVKTNEND